MVAWARQNLCHALLAAFACGGLQPAQAQAWQWQGSAGLLSDKVVYGISQSGGRASAVVDLSLNRADGWLAGAGLATLPAERGRAELSLLAGRSGPLGENGSWQATAGGLGTLGGGPLRRPAYLQLGLGYAWNERLQLGAWLAPRQPGPAAGCDRARGRVTVIEASWHQPIAHRLALDAGIGQVDYGPLALARYRYGSVGVSAGLGPVQVFVTRVFSDSPSPAAAGPRAVVSALVSL
jgi:hypothetical protein